MFRTRGYCVRRQQLLFALKLMSEFSNSAFKQFSMSSANKFCKVNPTASGILFDTIKANDVKGGTAGQVFQSNGLNGAFNTDLVLTGDLDVPGLASLTDTAIFGRLALGGLPGNEGQQVVCDATGVPQWDHLLYFVQYYQNAPTVNMNGADPVVLFTLGQPDQTSSKILFSAGEFTIKDFGTFNVRARVRASTSDAKTQVSIQKNGNYIGSATNTLIAGNTDTQDIIVQETIRAVPGDVIRIVSQPISGGPINTSGSDSNGIATSVVTIQKVGPSVFL